MKGSVIEEVFCHLTIYTIIDSYIFECRYLVIISTLKPLPTFKSRIYARAIQYIKVQDDFGPFPLCAISRRQRMYRKLAYAIKMPFLFWS